MTKTIDVAEKRVTYETGAVRSDDAEAKRFDLISPIGLRRLAETWAEGAAKYDDFNWEKGMPIADRLNHAIAHTFRFLAGDRSEDHLAHAAWGLFAAMHSEELWAELNEGTLRDGKCGPPKPTDPGAIPVERASDLTWEEAKQALTNGGDR